MIRVLLLFFAGLFCSAPCCFSQWAVSAVKSVKMEKQTSRVSEDFWLEITVRNTSDRVLYLQGISPRWYMVESFIRKPESAVWERQNTGVDQKLEMLPVKANEEIKILRREALKNIGRPVMLTLRMAYSEHDADGSVILLDAFKIPDLSEAE